MVIESAEFLIKAGMEEAFEAAVREATPLFRRARGCEGMEVQRGIEHPRSYRLLVRWQTVEDHNVHFRGSADFTEWRCLVEHCFDGTPSVSHLATVHQGF
ncbi:antibiotic biosynthesis monooxygenase [Massilia sp. Dwa41.01b]|uniref:antibiotic biosynthesis monooxygenase family protein n=1 Tax=unclassified Massilia TaxID=2609279 RepID=UPI001602B501|nr:MULTISPECIES: antibiotic biosynthesis monooxygenase family protein [unclassified Massilia]QNA89266.1 antibiotic biosynthesis monooxygenase [Massilia sp. Dwa41.01b]QNB00171.1 antibiotic biosynthesis monooxygenase [Massilia sp. Se16.2.3]